MYFVGAGAPIHDRYYCPSCYDLLEARALEETPDLFLDDAYNDAAAAQQLTTLLNLDRRNGPRSGNSRSPSMEMLFPVALIVDRLPFKRYYLTGAELDAHRELARQQMCLEPVNGSDSG